MRRTAAVIGTAAVTGLMLVGCGSSGSSASKDTTTTPAEAPTTTKAPMTEASLTGVLLTPTELGAGWTADTSSSSDSGPTPSCLQTIGSDTQVGEIDADASYTNGPTVFAGESLGAQTSAEVARSSYDEVTAALDSCTDLTITSDGQTITGTISPSGTTNYGDVSRSYSMNFDVQGVPLGFEIIVAQVGDTDMLVMYGAIGPARTGAAGSMADLAIKKLTTGAPA